MSKQAAMPDIPLNLASAVIQVVRVEEVQILRIEPVPTTKEVKIFLNVVWSDLSELLREKLYDLMHPIIRGRWEKRRWSISFCYEAPQTDPPP